MKTPSPDFDSDSQLDALFAEARARRPDGRASGFGLETRVLARIRAQRQEHESFGAWGSLAWKLAPLFALVVVLTGIGTYFAEQNSDNAQRLAIDPHKRVSVLNY
jgi:hypothetical protein